MGCLSLSVHNPGHVVLFSQTHSVMLSSSLNELDCTGERSKSSERYFLSEPYSTNTVLGVNNGKCSPGPQNKKCHLMIFTFMQINTSTSRTILKADGKLHYLFNMGTTQLYQHVSVQWL